MTMTYNTLSAQILQYLDRNDQATQDQIPFFISQAEQRICREAKTIGLEVYVTGTFIVGQNVITKPARWRRSISFNYGSGTNDNTRNQLFLRTYEYIRNYWPDDTQLAPPKFYDDYAYDHLIVAPTPDQTYPFEYSYLELPEPLGPSVSTNWLTNNAPDLIFYASMLEAVTFLKIDERVPLWQSMYDRALKSVTTQDEQRYVDRTSQREAD
jgi:hypothetical protein